MVEPNTVDEQVSTTGFNSNRTIVKVIDTPNYDNISL